MLSKGSVILTNEEHVLKAKIIQALKIVDGNFSFASANGDGDRFRTMFPDSAIAKSYKQGETKVKYCLQYGIAPHFKDLISKDLANSPFTFKFDETTTSQMKKQYIVNSSCEKKLLADFERKYSTKFLKLGSCSLHHVHNTFRKALQKLDIDIDQFACDVHFFLKLSSARREDYATLEELTNVTAWYALRHVSSRWLTLKLVIL